MTTQDRTKEPDDWILHDCGDDALEGDRWHCHRHDHKVWAFGATREDAIAAAWREVGRADLYALGARLCSGDILERCAHGHGYLLLDGHRVRPEGEEPSWSLSIDTMIGAHSSAIAVLHKTYGDFSDFDIADDLPEDPAAEYLEVLCRLNFEAEETDGYGRVTSSSSWGLEVVKIDGKPAIEVWT